MTLRNGENRAPGPDRPLSILEAMAAGLPVVSTFVARIPEAVEDGITGLLVPPEDAVALENALLRILNDEGLRRRMSAAALRRFAELYAIDRVADRYLELFRSLLA